MGAWCRAAPAVAPYAERFPSDEKLTYGVEWRLVDAGTAVVNLERDRADPKNWRFDVKIESAGLVSRLYHVNDSYRVLVDNGFCLANAGLDAEEGKRHLQSHFSVDRTRKKLTYEEHDLIRNTTEKKDLDVSGCTFEICSALLHLRTTGLEVNHSAILPMTNGKKYAPVRIAAQAAEKISVNGKSFDTVRYEAFLFDNIIYHRHGRLLIWLTNDASRLPVQFRLQLGFPIGTVTVSLLKRETQAK